MDRDMADGPERFRVSAPLTKESYLCRSIFEELFPHPSAAVTVPYYPSVACSSPIALKWDAAFQKNADPSGRAVNVHNASVVGE